MKERKALRMAHKSVACVTGWSALSLTDKGNTGRRAGVPEGGSVSALTTLHMRCL